MKALVTGGAGLIGSEIVDKLLDDGHEVISLDNYVAGKRANLDKARDFNSFTEVEGDILDSNLLETIFNKDIEWVFHQAVSKNTVCLADPIMDLQVNAHGTLKLLQFSKKYRINRFVHASTGSVYGNAQYYPTDEKHPRNPVSFYGNSKLAAENYVKLFNDFYDLPTTILRYFHVFGSRQDSSEVGGVIPIFIRRTLEEKKLQITGDGSQLRAFTNVSDVAQINLEIVKVKSSIGEIYNCASDNRITILQAANQILLALNKSLSQIEYIPERLGDVKKFDIDNQKLKNVIGNFKFTSFQNSLLETIEKIRAMKF